MRNTAALIVLLASGIWQVQAQVRLNGRVSDENNVPLAGAEVIVEGGSGKDIVFSDPTGAFVMSLPKAGQYTMRVALPGYFELRGRVLDLTSGANEVTAVLNHVREVVESADVSASPVSPEMDKAAVEMRLSGTDLMQLPYRTTDSPLAAARLLPGAVADRAGNIHVNGSRSNELAYTIDGFNSADVLTGLLQTRLSIEAVQLMTVVSGSAPAQYGKGSAGVLAIETRMGDNRLRYSATNFLPGVEHRKDLILGSWTPRFGISGPIRRDSIWFSDSLSGQYSNDIVPELPRGQDQTLSWRYANLFRTQANLTPSNILYAGWLLNQSGVAWSGLSALDPASTTVDLRALQNFIDAKDQIYLGRGSLVEFGFAVNRTSDGETPQGHDMYIYTPYGRRGNYFVDARRRASRYQWITNYFLPSFKFAGSHQMSAGIDVDRLFYGQNIARTGMMSYNAYGAPVREVTYTGSGVLDRSNFEAAAYLQDNWRLPGHLVLELGLRTEWDTILRNWNMSPRLAAAWAPFGLDRTKLSAGYSRLYDATNLGLFARSEDQQALWTYFHGPGSVEFQGMLRFAAIARGLASPRANNFNAGIDQQIGNGWVASVRAIMRRGSHGLSYFQMTPLSADTVYSLLDRRRDAYDAAEFTIRRSLHNQYEWFISYVRSRARSNAVIDLSADEPLMISNNSGRLPWDAPNRLMTWAFLPTLWKNWSLAYLFEWRTGFPYSIRNDAGQVIGNADGARFPQFVELDVYLERQFDFYGQRWAARVGANNILGRRNPASVNNDIDSPQYGTFYGGLGPSAGFRLRYLGKSSRSPAIQAAKGERSPGR